jgi:Secretion system C-terminal sorting domain
LKAARNSSAILAYNFLDKTPQKGVNYYRIKQIDTDGKVQLSQIQSVVFDSFSKIQVFPTIATDKIFIRRDDNKTDTSFEIINLLGQTYQSGFLTKNESLHTIDVSQLTAGSYFIHIANTTFRFVIQK